MAQAVIIRYEGNTPIWGNPSQVSQPSSPSPSSTSRVNIPQDVPTSTSSSVVASGQSGLTITPSNLWGTASNYLRPNEVEITQQQRMNQYPTPQERLPTYSTKIETPTETIFNVRPRVDEFSSLTTASETQIEVPEYKYASTPEKAQESYEKYQQYSTEVEAANIVAKEVSPLVEDFNRRVEAANTETKNINELMASGYFDNLPIETQKQILKRAENLQKEYQTLSSELPTIEQQSARLDYAMEKLTPERQSEAEKIRMGIEDYNKLQEIQGIEGEKIKTKFENIKKNYFGGKDATEENLNWYTKLTGYVPFGKYATKYDETTADLNKSVSAYETRFNVDITPEVPETPKLAKVDKPSAFQGFLDDELAYWKVGEAYGAVQERIKQKGKEVPEYRKNDYAMISAGLEGLKSAGGMLRNELTFPKLAMDTLMVGSLFIPGTAPVVAATRLGKLTSTGWKIGQGLKWYSGTSLLTTGVTKGIELRGDISESLKQNRILFGTTEQQIQQLQIAGEAEKQGVRPLLDIKFLGIGKGLQKTQAEIGNVATFLKSDEGRLIAGAALFAISKGKVGKTIGLGLGATALPGISGYTSSLFGSEKAFEKSLLAQGLTAEETEFLKTKRKSRIASTSVNLALIATSSELLGEKLYGQVIKEKALTGLSTTKTTSLYGIPKLKVTKAFKEAYISTRSPMLIAGAMEGLTTTKVLADSQFRKPSALEYGLFGVIGGVSARVVGGTVVGLSAARKTLPKTGKLEGGLMSYVYGTDRFEYIGDKFAPIIQNILGKRFGVDITTAYIAPGKTAGTRTIYAATRKGTRTPINFEVFGDIRAAEEGFEEFYQGFEYAYGGTRKARMKTGGYSTVVNVPTTTQTKVSTPTFIQTPTSISTPVSVPVSMPISVPISTPVSFPVNVRSPIFQPINTPSMLPISITQPISLPVSMPINVNVPQPISVPEPINVNVPQPVNVPIMVPNTMFPFVPFNFNERDGPRKPGTKSKKKTGYQADFISVIMGLTTRKKQTGQIWSGQELRPIYIGAK